jgi:hypothetical protein
MSDILNDAGNGAEVETVSNEPAEKPVSVRDALRAAMTDDGEKNAGGEKPAAAGDRNRDEAGRFAKPQQGAQGQQPAATAQQPVKPAQQQAAAPAQQQTPAPVAQTTAQPVDAPKPPPGWSAEAKAEFANLPPHVQAAVSKREQEVDQGFRVLQDYKGLEEFTPAIRQGGTTHAEVMRKALDYERSLQTNPVGTLIHVANIGGINLQALAQAIVAGKISLPQQTAQPQPQQPRPQPQVNVETAVEHALRKRDTLNQVDQFLSDPANVHAEAVMDDMVALINTGRATGLKDAYDTACWMRPDIRQQLISQTAAAPATPPQIAQKAAAADQARKASRSITGSSSAGASRNAGTGEPSSVRDALKEAMATSGSRI